MKHIGIIGAGATGLAAGYELAKQGHQVTLLEGADELGGLAASITVGGTRIERYYHHLFATDHSIIDLIKELGLGEKLRFQALPTGIFYQGKQYPFGSPLEMLSFSPVSPIDRIRFGASSAYLKALSNWKPLEQQNALKWTRKYSGKTTTAVIWEPLLRGKFGEHADSISMAWLWARIHSRTFKLGYLDGGFDQVYAALAKQIEDRGGEVRFSQRIKAIKQPKSKDPVTISFEKGIDANFDSVIATVPQPAFAKMIDAPEADTLWQNRYLGATCFVLELNQSFTPFYWLNINDTSFPFLAVVEHTQMIDKSQYGGRHVVYVGNYVPRDDWRFITDPEELLEKYIPYLKKINPNFDKRHITGWQFSKAPFAQPIVTPDYHTHIPAHTTPLSKVFLATMAQVYPQDRGQNYAVAMGQKVARMALEAL